MQSLQDLLKYVGQRCFDVLRGIAHVAIGISFTVAAVIVVGLAISLIAVATFAQLVIGLLIVLVILLACILWVLLSGFKSSGQ